MSEKTNANITRRTDMDSIWLKTSEKPHYDTLDGNKKLIIGGGISGILCAYLF